MKLTEKERAELAEQVKNLWNIQSAYMFFDTTCTTCHRRRRCICGPVDGTSLCSECYLEERIAERDRERLNLDLKDFASI